MHTCWNSTQGDARLSSNPESPKDLRFHDWCIRSWRFWQSSRTSWCANNPTRPRRRFALGRMFLLFHLDDPRKTKQFWWLLSCVTSPQTRDSISFPYLFLLLSCWKIWRASSRNMNYRIIQFDQRLKKPLRPKTVIISKFLCERGESSSYSAED